MLSNALFFVAVPTNPHEIMKLPAAEVAHQTCREQIAASCGAIDMPKWYVLCVFVHWLWKPLPLWCAVDLRPKFQWSYHLPNRNTRNTEAKRQSWGRKHQVGHFARLIANQHTPHIAGRHDLPCNPKLWRLKASKPKGSVCHTEASASCRQRPVLQVFLVWYLRLLFG